MGITGSPFEASIVMASALLAAMIGLLATLRRGHWLTTLVFAASFLTMAAFQAGTLGILNAGSPGAARDWAIYLARTSSLVAAPCPASSYTCTTWSGRLASIRYPTMSRYPCRALTGCPPLSFTEGGTEKKARYIRLEVSRSTDQPLWRRWGRSEWPMSHWYRQPLPIAPGPRSIPS